MDLKTIRTQRLLSQEDLAKLSGLNVRTIQRIESGGKPSVESLKCLASALEIDIPTITQESTMSKVESNTLVGTVRAQASNISLLLSTAAILIVLASNSSGALGAIYYLISAVCFLVSAHKMYKYKLGTKI
jgi:transcriptional regulator with XRE-family HTH domain